MTIAHVMGMPVEESALALAPAGAAILTGAAIITRSKLTQITRSLRHLKRSPRTTGSDVGPAEGPVPPIDATEWNPS